VHQSYHTTLHCQWYRQRCCHTRVHVTSSHSCWSFVRTAAGELLSGSVQHRQEVQGSSYEKEQGTAAALATSANHRLDTERERACVHRHSSVRTAAVPTYRRWRLYIDAPCVILSDTARPPDLQLGRRVAIWWDGNQAWNEGLIRQVDVATGRIRVRHPPTQQTRTGPS
jgi:hypothetical protein